MHHGGTEITEKLFSDRLLAKLFRKELPDGINHEVALLVGEFGVDRKCQGFASGAF